eukprot:TRINITY_DN1688_c0_g1_i3.p1 TRINITY_DN1688_c0_g1~~TRINITY_DN1688_c0_g1_i3.p1  ORF type:complete len:134 (-),score=38.86 TRINITY_DN1688_c0_g1_i3:267-668(-)
MENKKEDWEESWDKIDNGELLWTRFDSNQFWEKDYQEIEKKISKKIDEKSKWFVPFCGSSPVVKFLWEKGHTVVCSEFVHGAVINLLKLFEEKLKFETEKLGNEVILHTSSDKRVLIYEGDYFKCSFGDKSFD